jgi:hypothetical protein
MMGTSGSVRLGHTPKRLCSKIHSVSTQPYLAKERGYTSFFKHSGKKLAVVLSIIAVVIITLALLIPQGAATIPLNVSYTVGEKLVYYTTESGTSGGFNFQAGQMQMDQNFSLNSIDTEEVQSFDGQAYNISHTEVLNVNDQQQLTTSYNELLNKTGYSEIISPGLAPNQGSLNESAVNPVLAFLAMPEVKVGDTEVIPITTSDVGTNTTGNVTVTFVDIQNITVPAGTFNVFRVDSSSSDTTHTFQHGFFGNGNESMTLHQTFSGQSYIEYDTGKLIESTENMNIATEFDNSLSESNLPSPILANNFTINTQLADDLMAGQALPSPPPPQQLESSSFLEHVSNLDMSQYTVQSQEALADGFYKCTLTSSDSSLDALFNLNNSHVVWCKLYPSQGSPAFAAPPASNVEAATVFLVNYHIYSQAPYIQSMQTMLDNVTSNMSTTLTQGTIALNVSVNGSVTNFVWTNTENTNRTLTLTIQNGGFSLFCDSWT